jgi:hypothetical protein
MNNEIGCAECAFYDKAGPVAGWGYCRRYAPRPLVLTEVEDNDDRWTCWPRVAGDDLCGEAREREN